MYDIDHMGPAVGIAKHCFVGVLIRGMFRSAVVLGTRGSLIAFNFV